MNTDVGLDVYPSNDAVANGGHGCPEYKYCPKGTGKTGLATDIPLDIPKGTMQELFARGDLSDAIQIPAGWYTLEVIGDPLQKYITTPCAAGHYCPFGSYEMVQCPAGTFRSDLYGKDVTDCGLCAAGKYCDEPGMGEIGVNEPKACGTGRFCPEGSQVESLCPRGTFNDVTGLYDSRGC